MPVCGKRIFPLSGPKIQEGSVYYNIALCLPLTNQESAPYSGYFQIPTVVRQPAAALFLPGPYPVEERSYLMFCSLIENIEVSLGSEHGKIHPYWMIIWKQ